MNTTIHPFESAGLGLAPFCYVGSYEKRGPISLCDGTTVGAPGQPMGCCDYCGNGIAICCEIRSTDGKTFVVGSDCVRKTNAEGSKIVSAVQKDARERTRQRKWDRHHARLKKCRQLLDDNPQAFKDRPHTKPFRAEKGDTFRNEIEWYLRNAGMQGQSWACKEIENMSDEHEA